MVILSEYLTVLPITNLWNIWIIFFIALAVTIWLAVEKHSVASGTMVIPTVIAFIFASVISIVGRTYIECVGYIERPEAFVEMLNDYDVVSHEGDLYTLRSMYYLTEEEIKEYNR